LDDAIKITNQQKSKKIISIPGKIQHENTIRVLKMVLKDSGRKVRPKPAVVKAPGDTNDARAVEPLSEALKEENKEVRIAAAESLGKIRDPGAVGPLTEALKDKDEQVRNAAGEALVKTGKPAVIPLYDVFIHSFKVRNDQYQKISLGALVKIGEDAVNPLNHPLWDKTSEPELRDIVVQALGKIGQASAGGDLVHALKDENAQVRYDAAESLGKIGDPRPYPSPVEPLKHGLMKEKDPRVKSAMITALEEIEKKFKKNS
jgi:HEAT repeat protein